VDASLRNHSGPPLPYFRSRRFLVRVNAHTHSTDDAAGAPLVPDPTDLTETIAAEAQLPAASAVDGQSADGQPLPDLIAADKHLTTKTALTGTNPSGGPKSGWRGLRPARAVPPGGG
jgi:hypothetical protein